MLSSVVPRSTQVLKPRDDSPWQPSESDTRASGMFEELVKSESSVLLLRLAQVLGGASPRCISLIDKEVLISLPDPSACVAGFPLSPLSEVERRLELHCDRLVPIARSSTSMRINPSTLPPRAQCAHKQGSGRDFRYPCLTSQPVKVRCHETVHWGDELDE